MQATEAHSLVVVSGRNRLRVLVAVGYVRLLALSTSYDARCISWNACPKRARWCHSGRMSAYSRHHEWLLCGEQYSQP
eukprot:365318-Chlamydomonas_euryale.AAC.8